jgi:hypothetical protein
MHEKRCKIILDTLNIEAHIRNDVKQSVGLVVTLDWVDKVDVSDLSLDRSMCYFVHV